MIGNIKVLNSMLIHYIATTGKRKKYGHSTTKYDKKESRHRIYDTLQKLCCKMLKAGGITVEVSGKEHLPKTGPVLYVANHKSIFDIVVLVSLIEDPCIFIGKKELAKMPVVGKWFDALGCIYIDREDVRQSLKAVMTGISELKEGQSIVLFPEGTRTYAKEMKSFKAGGFKLATKTGVPIVPIALQNTYKVFEENKTIRKTKTYVNVGETIYQSDLSEEELKNLPKYVHHIVEELLKEISIIDN